MSELLDLINTCKRAIEPDRQLDARIGRTMGWVQNCDPSWGIGAPHWSKDGQCQSMLLGPFYYGDSGSLPPFTFSVDAALLLLPKEYVWLAGTDFELPGMCRLYDGNTSLVRAQSISPAFSIVIASLLIEYDKVSKINKQ